MKKEAFKESLYDTVIATPINLALNFILISVGFMLELGPTELTFFVTAFLFVFAVIRKYYVRIYFEKRNNA